MAIERAFGARPGYDEWEDSNNQVIAGGFECERNRRFSFVHRVS